MSAERLGLNIQKWLVRFLSFGLLLTSGFSANEEEYSQLQYGDLPFPEGGIVMEPTRQAEFLNALAAIARNYDEVPNSIRSHAVALARRVDPLHKPSFIADYQLNRGVKPEPIREFSTKDDAVREVYRTTLDFSRAENRKANEFAGYLFDLLKSIDPLDSNYESLLEDYEKEFSPVDWNLIVPVSTLAGGGFDAPPPLSLSGNGHEIAFLSTEGILKIHSKSESGGTGSLQIPGGNQIETAIFKSAFHEGVKYLGQKKSGATRGWTISFSTDGDFEEDFLAEQGPAAALGSVLSMQALVENKGFDPMVAFAGDVNADGSIQPIHDIRSRLIAIGKSEVKIIAVPMADADSLGDILILKGPRVFAERQIFGVRSMTEASKLSAPVGSRTEKLQQAIDQFSEIQEVLLKPGGLKHLSNSHVLGRLQEVIQLAPNHLSAKMLALRGLKRAPTSLTLGASLELVMKPLEDFISKNKEDVQIGFKNASLNPEAVRRLQRYSDAIDGRLKKLASAVVNLSNAGRVGSEKFKAQEMAATRLEDELAAVSRNIDVREEMMR